MLTSLAFRPDAQGLRRMRTPQRLGLYATVAGLSFVAYILARLLDGPASTAFAVFGVSACGWAWLLTRALFDPAPRDVAWPLWVVVVLTATGAVSRLASGDDGVGRVAENLYALTGSAALLLTFIEPFQRRGCDLSQGERRFRVVFTIVFTLLVCVSVLGVTVAPGPVETVCAVIGLIGVFATTLYRSRHPLRTAPPEKRAATEEDRRLAARVIALLERQAVHAEPDLKIGDLAARLGEPEYKISRCISAATDFPNFNRLINHHRIEDAKRRLRAPGRRASILEIALDCGFGSVGPFNRAFREQTGMTPRAYRALAEV
jgi:AraC-like DNA-binding protein